MMTTTMTTLTTTLVMTRLSFYQTSCYAHEKDRKTRERVRRGNPDLGVAKMIMITILTMIMIIMLIMIMILTMIVMLTTIMLLMILIVYEYNVLAAQTRG